jgi:hypothetical protein
MQFTPAIFEMESATILKEADHLASWQGAVVVNPRMPGGPRLLNFPDQVRFIIRILPANSTFDVIDAPHLLPYAAITDADPASRFSRRSTG